MTEHPASVMAYDGSWWRLINNEWVGWMPGHEDSWTGSEAAMEQYFPEVVQRWERPDEGAAVSDDKQENSLRPTAICECGSQLSAGGWCGTCREFIWRIR